MKPLAPETARLLADVTGQQPASAEAPEERLARLEKHPAALFAAINLHRPPPDPLNDMHGVVRAAIATTLIPVHESPEKSDHCQPITVLRELRKTAPAVAASASRREEHASHFNPTAEDRDQAIEAWESEFLQARQLLAFAVICALALVLLLQFG